MPAGGFWRTNMKWALAFGLATAAAGAAWQLHPADKIPSPETTAAEAERTPGSRVQGTGYVEPASEVRKLMPRTGGVIKRCPVSAGVAVRKGEVLVELEDATQRAEVEGARRQLELARAEAASVLSGVNPYRIKVVEQAIQRLREKVRHSTLEVRRYQAMLQTRSASLQEHEQVETQRRQAEAELKEQEAELVHLRQYVTPETRALQEARVNQARANLATAEERLRETRLTAPFDGVLLKVLKREGDSVWPAAGDPVLLFGDLSRLRVRAEIDERFVRQVKVGQPAAVSGHNLGGHTYPGRVVVVEPVMGDRTVFAHSPSERKDLQVLQVLIELGPDFCAPAGLQVEVAVEVQVP
jgi:multidrug resistance efflux pump